MSPLTGGATTTCTRLGVPIRGTARRPLPQDRVRFSILCRVTHQMSNAASLRSDSSVWPSARHCVGDYSAVHARMAAATAASFLVRRPNHEPDLVSAEADNARPNGTRQDGDGIELL